MGKQTKPVLCLTFDNLGEARDVGLGKAAVPDLAAPGVATGYPKILSLLARYDLRATFFIEGWSALHYDDVVDSLQAGGHDIGLHGWVHEVFGDLDERSARQSVSDGLQVMKLRGLRPAGFRAPGGRIGPYGHTILGQNGFSYDSSVDTALPQAIPLDIDGYVGDGLKRLPNGLVGIPWQWFMIDAVHYFLAENGLRDPRDLADYWGRVLRNVARAGGLVTVISHAHVTGVDPDRLDALERTLNLAQELGFAIQPCASAMQRTEHLT